MAQNQTPAPQAQPWRPITRVRGHPSKLVRRPPPVTTVAARAVRRTRWAGCPDALETPPVEPWPDGRPDVDVRPQPTDGRPGNHRRDRLNLWCTHHVSLSDDSVRSSDARTRLD